MYLLGYDIGSSSVKAALVDTGTGLQVAVVQSPEAEMTIHAPQAGWAEQDPDTWWEHVCAATQKLLRQTGAKPEQILAIGIAYQMHGLVLVDAAQRPLRPAIIWCDSRAVAIGERAATALGESVCRYQLLNTPGNFTASKFKWVSDHEPDVYARTHKAMLPGDFIAMRLTGEIATTASGLSEGILWDFQSEGPARVLLDEYGLDESLLADVVATFSVQGRVSPAAALATGLAVGTPVTYRAGDQPNNALALNVLEPGEIAATGGTSGVVYGVVDTPVYDAEGRVNTFAHVNHTAPLPRLGILLCINGAGIQYSWMKHQAAAPGMAYPDMEALAATVPAGSDGLHILPFGNGAERMLGNRSIGAHIANLQFNRHQQPHLYRAALEGVAFAFVYGMKVLHQLGLDAQVMRVGNDNLFQSAIFSHTVAALMDCRIEMSQTTGAIGAAKAAGVAVGVYASVREAVAGNAVLKVYEPALPTIALAETYQAWCDDLEQRLR